MALIVCTECGNEFSEHAKACPKCGCPIEVIKGQVGGEKSQPIEQTVNHYSVTTDRRQDGAEKSESTVKKKIIPLILVAVIAILLLCFCIFVLPSFSQKKIAVFDLLKVAYDSENDRQCIYWQFKDDHQNAISAPASLDITITNANGDVVFTNTIQVDKSFFSSETSDVWPDDTLHGCVYVKNSDIEKSRSPLGSITVSARTSDAFFDEIQVEACDLPEVESVLSYIGSRSVDYESANLRHRVFWGFSDQDNYPMIVDANITISIVNKHGETVYNKTTFVDSSYYTTWTNKYWDSDHLLGCIYINDSEITPGSSDAGTISISAEAEGLSFSEETLDIFNLPIKALDLTLVNELPQKINEYGLRNQLQTTVTVQNVEYDYQYYNYSDTVTLTVHYTTKLDYSYKGKDVSYSYLGYKLTDSNGIVVSGGNQQLDQATVGDVFTSDQIIFDLSLKESYTLELMDATR